MDKCIDCKHFAEQTKGATGLPTCDMDDPECEADENCFEKRLRRNEK